MEILWESLPPAQRKKALNKPNQFGLTPLHEACLDPMPPQIWLENNPRGDVEEYTQKYQKTMTQKPEMVDWLLKHGANLPGTKAKINGDTPIEGKILELTPLELLEFNLNAVGRENPLVEETMQKCQQVMNAVLKQNAVFSQVSQRR